MISWPDELIEVFDRSLTVTFTSVTKSGQPISTPLTPYLNRETNTLDVSTGLTYPTKAERTRNNPLVTLVYNDPIGLGISEPPVVVVEGHGAVRDSDLQGNLDRYIRLSSAKLPDAMKGQPKFILKRFPWYFSRIWIEITPIKITWWPRGDLTCPPKSWTTDLSDFPASDAKPLGANQAPWLEPPDDWKTQAEVAISRLGLRDLAFVDPNGQLFSLPVREVTRQISGFDFFVPPNFEIPNGSKASLVFHDHPERFTGQENRTFLGIIAPSSTRDPGRYSFEVTRLLADWSLPGNKLMAAKSFLSNGRKLAPRLKFEAQRRGQPIPKVRFPK